MLHDIKVSIKTTFFPFESYLLSYCQYKIEHTSCELIIVFVQVIILDFGLFSSNSGVIQRVQSNQKYSKKNFFKPTVKLFCRIRRVSTINYF